MVKEASTNDIDAVHTTDDGEVDDGEEQHILHALIARRLLRRRWVRRAILMHLLRTWEPDDTDEDDADGVYDADGDGEDDEARLLRLLIGGRLLRRRRARRLAIAKLLKDAV